MNKAIAAVVLVASASVIAARADAEAIKLRFGHPANPRAHLVAEMCVPWAERVSKASEGTLDVTVFAGGQLGGNEVLLDAVKSGVADIGWVNTGYYPGRFPKSQVGELPFEVASAVPASVAIWRLYQNGLLADEYKDVRPLAIFALPQMRTHSKFPINRLEDLRGRKIGAVSQLTGSVLSRLGATPVTVEFSDLYTSISRGTIDGTLLQWTGVQPIRLWEVTKYHTESSLGGSVIMIAMNRQSYDRLPPKAKEAIDRHSGESWSREWGEFWDRVDQSGRELVRKEKGIIAELPAAEEQRWRDAIGPITDDWVKRQAGGAQVLQAFREERDRAGR